MDAAKIITVENMVNFSQTRHHILRSFFREFLLDHIIFKPIRGTFTG